MIRADEENVTIPDAATKTTRSRTRFLNWLGRAVPLTVVALLLAGAVTLVSPGARRQLELSLSKQSTPFVQLYFARSVADGGQAVCSRTGSTVIVRFVVASHLDSSEKIDFEVTVNPGSDATPVTRRGQVLVREDQAAGSSVRLDIAPSERSYVVSVELPTWFQEIRAHCPGDDS